MRETGVPGDHGVALGGEGEAVLRGTGAALAQDEVGLPDARRQRSHGDVDRALPVHPRGGVAGQLLAGEGLLDDGLEALAAGPLVEALGVADARGAHLQAQFVVPDQAPDRPGHGLHVTARDDQPVLAVGEDVARPVVGVGGDDGQSGGHRLDEDVAERLPLGGQDEDRALAELRGDGRGLAHQQDAVGQPQFLDAGPQLLLLGAVAVDAQGPLRCLGVDLGEGLDQQGVVLVVGEVAGGDDHLVGTAGADRGRGHAVGHHREAVAHRGHLPGEGRDLLRRERREGVQVPVGREEALLDVRGVDGGHRVLLGDLQVVTGRLCQHDRVARAGADHDVGVGGGEVLQQPQLREPAHHRRLGTGVERVYERELVGQRVVHVGDRGVRPHVGQRPDPDPRVQREVRLVAHLAQRDDLDVVPLGQGPGEVLRGADHAPHVAQVPNEECDLHFAASLCSRERLVRPSPTPGHTREATSSSQSTQGIRRSDHSGDTPL